MRKLSTETWKRIAEKLGHGIIEINARHTSLGTRKSGRVSMHYFDPENNPALILEIIEWLLEADAFYLTFTNDEYQLSNWSFAQTQMYSKSKTVTEAVLNAAEEFVK